MKTDSQLQTDVLDQLQWRPDVNAAHIGVAANSSTVTLTGQVAHYVEKAAAESAAKGVYGVKAVANDITVEIPGTSTRTDQDIAQAAVNALKWDFEIPKDAIKVVVKNGWVTLEGMVDWQYQKDAAKRCVQYLMGVSAVNNAIVVKPKVNTTDVKSRIEESFRRNADVDARRISVSASGGTVTLSGNVSSWSERSEAVTAAWAAPGVSSVNDQLAVMF
ncbi:MAG: BON domain-containing protein [Fibrella sp.]|nr:BON domain-containing protein [Armatimonadota bacterium]